MPPEQTLSPTTKTTTTWDLDPDHSRAEFAIKHLMVATVRGTIPVRTATVVRDEADLTRSRVEAELDPAGIDTGSQARDADLRSPNFFDVEKFPAMRFRSTRIEAVEDGLRVHGELTIRDATRPVVLDLELLGEATDPWGQRKAAASATTVFDRHDFGLHWNAALETGGVLVGDKVKVQLDLQFTKQA